MKIALQRWTRLLQREALWLAGIVLGACVFGIAGIWLVERELVSRAGESLRIGAFDVAGKLEGMFQERTGDLKLLAEAAQVRNADVGGISKYLRVVQQAYPVYSRLAVANRTGRIIASTDADWIGQDVRSAAWFQTIWHGLRTHITIVTAPGQAEGSLDRVQFSAAILDEWGNIDGAVLTEIDRAVWRRLVEDTVGQFAVQAQHAWGMRYKVLDQDGTILLSSDSLKNPDDNVLRMGLPSATLVKMGRLGYVEEQHLMRKVPVVTGYARTGVGESVGMVQWGVLVRTDRDEVLAGIRSLLMPVVLPGGVFASAVILWALQGKRRADRRRVEACQNLQERETQFRMVLDHAMDAVIIMNAQGLVVSWNAQASALFGWAEPEIIGQDLAAKIIPPRHREAHTAGIARYVATGEGVMLNQRVELTGLRKDGIEFPIEVTVTAVPMADGPLFSAFVRDLTQHKQMMQRLQEREAFFRLLSEHLPIGVFELTEQGQASYTNKTWGTILQQDMQDLFGFGTADLTADWLEWFHPEDRVALEKAWVASREAFSQLRQECRLASGEGETRWAQVLLWPMASDAGFRYFGTIEDITERKRTTAHALQLLHQGQFEFHTTKEAKALAELLAYAFPDEARSHIGLLELLINGVEHGNLGISFDEKTELLDKGLLDAEIARRLVSPAYAGKRVRVTLTRTDREVRLVIVDDGQGFDWRAHLAEKDGMQLGETHGRGIAMAKLISFDALEYKGCGNHVEVSTKLSNRGPDLSEAA